MNRKQFLATIAALPIVGRLIAKDKPGVGLGGKPFKLTFDKAYYSKYPLTPVEYFYQPKFLGVYLSPIKISKVTQYEPAIKNPNGCFVVVDNVFRAADILVDEAHNTYRVIHISESFPRDEPSSKARLYLERLSTAH